MDLEEQVREAILAELRRQSELGERALSFEPDDEDGVTIQGRVDLDELTMAVVGAVAGGP
ncbi:MAG: hypothetical protein ACK41C_10875 [Phenylobacterium sp.]|jgi:hypothetical protein|uniref:hypothetical protein n=1 Tax=Phenylobacterium sp. TaxID=1871053 RepID=UPI00391A55CF